MTAADDHDVYVDGLRRPHGNQASSRVGPVVELPPADELQPGVVAPADDGAESSGPVERGPDGRVTGEGAVALGRRSAAARARRKQWEDDASRLRVMQDATGNAGQMFGPRASSKVFIDHAERWYAAKAEELARDVGGGELGAGVLAVLRGASHQHGQSLFYFELAGGPLGSPFLNGKLDARAAIELVQTASRLADACRQSLLAAHHLARLEALARKERVASDARAAGPLAKVFQALPKSNGGGR